MSKNRKRKSRPYLMGGSPRVTEPRATVLDAPDNRIPELHTRKLTPAELQKIPIRAVPPFLRVVDNCFERWANTPLSDYAPPGYAHVILAKRSIPARAPLDDAESKIVDAAIRASPIWAYGFVYMCYRQGLTLPEIAKTLQMKRQEYVYTHRDLVLSYYLGRLHVIGLFLKAEA